MDYPQTDAVHVIPQENLDAEPPSKRTRNSGTPLTDTSSSDTTTASAPSSSTARARAIGKMFFKTKLCCKFRAGTCPYVTNCNFAHSMEEIRRPPPNWQEIVAVHEEERESRQGGNGNSGRNSVEPGNNSNASGGEVREVIREEFQIPCTGNYGGDVGSTGGSSGNRVYKGRHCKKFYTEEGCPYGDACSFLHDEQSKNRESVAISLGPGGYSGGGGGGGGGGVGGGGGSVGGGGGGVSGSAAGAAGAAGASGVKPSNWKTRICNKWELTGYCPFGNKCHFAHGSAELHRYGGGLVENEARDPSSAPPPDQKQAGAPLKSTADSTAASIPSVSHPDVYHVGVLPQRPMLVIHRTGQRTHHKWKGPDKISLIYGDWIDEAE